MDYENPWTFNNVQVTDDTVEGYLAFVYMITNTESGKQYIGKKRLHFSKTKTVNKKKKKFKVPSDWKEYYGSNKELSADVEKLGSHKFKREILRLCVTLGESTYYEAYEQFVREVLLYPDKYYNEWLSCRTRRSHIKHLIAKGKGLDNSKKA